jgi:hypothetical protein
MAADGRIEIDTRIEKQNVEQELRQLKREISLMAKEMQLANLKGMMPFQKQLLESQKKMYNLAATMHQFSGTNAEFMQQVKQLGAEYKKANDAMINANNMAKVSMIQTAGQMMNMTTQAKRISDNYDRMGNALYKVNKAGLAVADRMNQIANNGNAAVLALRMLGPTASTKQLLDMQMMINQGLMRFQMVALSAAVTGALLYSSLHEAAKKANKEYAQSFETMLAALRKAFKPMVQVFAEVMTHVYKFITAIANMIIKFNEAHPVLAKILQGILMLIPALTLLLSPLAIGIGLLAGFQAAWASIWTMIGPLVTGLAAMSATVWIVAAAIVGLTAFLVHLWKTNEGFRNAVISAWNQIKATAASVWNFIWNSILKPIWNALVSYGKQVIEQLRQFWEKNGEQIKQAAQVVWSFISKYISSQLKTIAAIFQATFPVIQKIVQTAWNFIKEVINGTLKIVLGLVKTFASLLTGDWKGAWEGIKSILKGALQIVVATIKNSFIGQILSTIASFVSQGISKISSFSSSLRSKFSEIVSSATSKFNAVKNAIMRPIEQAVSFVRQQVAKIVGFFRNARISFPKIKLPHFSISGKFSLMPPSVPKINVSWYKKGGLFPPNSPQLIGIGDANVPEAALPLSPRVLGMIGDRIAQHMPMMAQGSRSITIETPIYLDGYEIARAIFPYNETMQGNVYTSKLRMNGVRV